MNFAANKILSCSILLVVFFACKKDTTESTTNIDTLNGATINQELIGKWKLYKVHYRGLTHNNCQYAIDTYYDASVNNLNAEFEVTSDGWLIYRDGDTLERAYKISSSHGNQYYVNGTLINLMQFSSVFDDLNVGDSVDFLDFFYSRFNNFDNNITVLRGGNSYIKIE